MKDVHTVPSPEEIRALKNQHGLTGADMARMTGVNNRTPRKWLGGETDIQLANWRLLLLLTREMTVDEMAEAVSPPVDTGGYTRSATGFDELEADGVLVRFIHGSEGYSGIHSIMDTARGETPAVRVDPSTAEELPLRVDPQETEEPPGLIVFGTRKYDRPSPEWVSDRYPQYEQLMALVRDRIDEYSGD